MKSIGFCKKKESKQKKASNPSPSFNRLPLLIDMPTKKTNFFRSLLDKGFLS